MITKTSRVLNLRMILLMPLKNYLDIKFIHIPSEYKAVSEKSND